MMSTVGQNFSSKVVPAPMKMKRMTIAPKTPQNNTLCWYFKGTANDAGPRSKAQTKTLSTLKLFSIAQPE